MMTTTEPLFFDVMVMMTAAVTYIDASAVQALKDLYQEYKLRDIQVGRVRFWTFIDGFIHEIITTSLLMFFPPTHFGLFSFCRLQYQIQTQKFCLRCLNRVWWS